MRAGGLKWRITILRETEIGRTAANEPIMQWVEVRTVRAAKLHKSEDEAFTASRNYEVRNVTFRTYFLAELLSTDRIRCDGEEYDVKGWREIGFRHGMDVTAELRR